MNYQRMEQLGKVVYLQGGRILKIPTEDSCRDRLIKLLEESRGEKDHPKIREFWKERCRETGDPDEMKRAWASELFDRLEKIWDELTVPQAPETVSQEVDVFSDFGV